MNLKNLPILLVCFLFASCKNDQENKSKSSTEQDEKKTAPVNCYMYTTTQDTIILKLIHPGDSITGTLVYKLMEKDKNVGTIKGSMQEELLVADYTFMSEGVMSVRQIVFKKEQNYFIEGHGDIKTINEKVSFKNLDSLQFDNSAKLLEINCQK